MVDIHVDRRRRRLGRRSPTAPRCRSGPSPPARSRGRCATAAAGPSPTVTDADLVLGRLDPEAFWSGRSRLDATKARTALDAVGEALGLGAEETAVAAVRVVDAHMTDAVRRVLSSRRRRPARGSTSCAFGGMGAAPRDLTGRGARQCIVCSFRARRPASPRSACSPRTTSSTSPEASLPTGASSTWNDCSPSPPSSRRMPASSWIGPTSPATGRSSTSPSTSSTRVRRSTTRSRLPSRRASPSPARTSRHPSSSSTARTRPRG